MRNPLLTVSRCTAVATLLAVMALPAAAQRRLTFNPYLYLEQSYADNVRFQPETVVEAQDEEATDTFTRAAIVLPLAYELPREGGFWASYRYFIDRFDDNEDLDSDGHRFNVAYETRPSEPSLFRIGGSYEERDDQGRVQVDELIEDFFLTPRLTRTITRVQADYTYRFSPTWRTSFGLGYSEFDFEKVAETDPDFVLTRVQGRHGPTARWTLEKQLSERTTTGFFASYSDYTLDPIPGDPTAAMEGEDHLAQASLFLRHQPGPLWRFEGHLGVFRRTGFAADGRDLFRDGVAGRASLFRSFVRTELELFASYAPTDEGVLRGTQTVAAGGVALRDTTPGRWDWRIFTRYATRDPSVEEEAEIDSYSGGGYLQWNLQRLVSVRLEGLYLDQTSDDFFSERSFYRITLGLYWFPLGRTELGGAPTVPFRPVD